VWGASGRGSSAGDDPDVPVVRGRLSAARPPLDRRCAALIKQVRANCPGVIPDEPLTAGTPSPPVPVDGKEYAVLVQVAARQAVAMAALGRLPGDDADLPGVVVWENGGASLAVGLDELAVEVTDGEILVTLPVFCDQLPDRRAEVRIVFAVGSRERPAGLLAATPAEPRGPRIVVAAWGEQLTALAWQALLDTASGVAASAGTDTDGTPLVATALAAGAASIEVQPQARHPFDRRPGPRAVVR
jgi:hypothetical protein